MKNNELEGAVILRCQNWTKTFVLWSYEYMVHWMSIFRKIRKINYSVETVLDTDSPMGPLKSSWKIDQFWSLNHRDPMNGSEVMGRKLYLVLAPFLSGEEVFQSGKNRKTDIFLEPLNRFEKFKKCHDRQPKADQIDHNTYIYIWVRINNSQEIISEEMINDRKRPGAPLDYSQGVHTNCILNRPNRMIS